MVILLGKLYLPVPAKQDLKENIVLFTGDDHARLDGSLGAWVAEFEKRHGVVNVEDVDFLEYQGKEDAWGTVLGGLLTPSLFAEKRLMIVRRFPLDVMKKVPEDLEKMEQQCVDVLRQVPPDVVVLLIARKPDKRRSSYKKINSFVRVKEFSLKDIDVRAQVTMELAGMVASEDIAYLVHVLESRRSSLSEDMTMLRQYGMTNPLTRDVIEKLCPPRLEDSIFQILEEVFAGRRKQANQRLRQLFAMGAVPLQVLGAFTWQIESIALARAALDARWSQEEAAQKTGMKPYSLQKATRIAQKLTPKAISQLVHGLATIDRQSKNGTLTMDGQNAEFSLALEEWIMRVPVGASA